MTSDFPVMPDMSSGSISNRRPPRPPRPPRADRRPSLAASPAGAAAARAARAAGAFFRLAGLAGAGAEAEAAFFFAVLRFAVRPLDVVFLAAMGSVNSHVVAGKPVVGIPGTFHQNAEIVERDPAIDLAQGPLDEVLQLRGVEEAGAAQGHQMPPRLGGEAAPLMGA